MHLKQYTYEIHPEVESDYNTAYSWYELQQEGLGELFLVSVREKINLIKQGPETYGVKLKKGIREAKINGFPYLIVYKIYPKSSTFLIISIVHEKMSPKKKYIL